MEQMRKKPYSNKPEESLALSRIIHLFEQAQQIANTHPELSDRYITLAWNIKLRTRCKIPPPYNRQFCRDCLSYWGNGKVRIRTQGKHVVYTCLACKKIRRFVYKP